MQLKLNRRALLATAGAAGLAASLPVGLVAAAEALEAEAPGGSLLAWLRETPDGSIRVSIATVAKIGDAGPEWRAIGPVSGVALKLPHAPGKMSLQSWETRTRALSHTRDLVAGVVAERWKVPAAECEILPDRIVHTGSDRCTAYRTWVKIA
jgi:hypothetical protein